MASKKRLLCGTCPTHSCDQKRTTCAYMSTEELQALYTKEDIESLQIQAHIDQIHGEDLQKLEKIRFYCEEKGYKHIGIAYGYHAKMAACLSHIYLSQYFQVASVVEYIGGFSRDDFFTLRHEKSQFHPFKNPIGMASLLEDVHVDFVIIMDLDVGVDTLFCKHCGNHSIPVTFLHLDLKSQ